MRSVLVCFLAALAVSANVPKPFKGDQSYVYRFDTQVSSSLIGSTPNEIQQSATTRLRADVQISFTDDRHAKLRLHNVRLGEQNGELPKSQRVQPLEHFERRELPTELKQDLEMPVSVSYVDGVVERINFHEDDSTFSKNIKRAVLNMMQLNLKRNDVQGLKMQSSMPELEKERNIPVFHIPEITLEGECETVYTMQKNQQQQYDDEEQRSVFNVTKTINFNKCQRTADITYGYQSNPSQELRCLNCIRQQKPQPDAQTMENVRFSHCQLECQPNKVNENNDVERSTFARFELTGKPERFGIKRASMISQYIVKGQNPASQNAITQVISLAELTFKEQSEGSKMVPSFKQSSTDDTLMYQPEWDVQEKRFYMFGDKEFEQKNSPFRRVQQKEQKVAHALRTILQQWGKQQQGYELDTAVHFNRLVELIRQSSVKEIRNIEEVVRSISQQTGEQSDDQDSNPQDREEHAKAIFMDGLAVAATRNSLYVLAEKIIKQEIPTKHAVQALQIFVANQHSPSDQQAEILERIAKHEVAHRSPALKQTAWLSFGTAVGAICQDKPTQGQQEMFRVEELCPRGKKEQYKQSFIKLWQQSGESVYEQILALKAIGNAALDNTIEDLQEIVKQKRQPILIRMEAIDAMRRLRTSMPHKIRQVLLPIFQNQREQPEIRMAAFSMILYTHPEKPLLDQLTFTIINDRSQNVKSFVLSAMDALSKSPSSAEQEVANHMKAALKMVKIDAEELRASRKYRVPIYVSQKENTEEQNVFLGLASIVSPSNMIPVHLSASLRSAFNGEATEENLQVSFSQKNLEQWYEKLGDYMQSFGDDDDDKQERSEGRQSGKDLRSIYSSLGIKSRRHGSYYLSDEESEENDQSNQRMADKIGSKRPFGMIVLRYSDVDAAVIPLSEEQLPQIVRKLIQGEKPSLTDFEELSQKLASGHKLQRHTAFSLGEKKTKIPTTSGMPVALIRQTSGVASMEAQLKMDFESTNLESSRGANTHLKLRASAIATHTHKTEVWTPVLITGVETHRTVEVNGPIEVKVRVDKKQLQINVLPPKEHKTRFFAIHTLPMTYTQQVDMETQTRRERRVRSIHNWALEHTQREHNKGQQSDDIIQIDGHYHHLTNPKQILQALYTTENNVHYYYNPNSERAPKELTLRLSGSLFQKHSEHSQPEMDNFYSSSNKNKGFQAIYEEDFENMDNEKDEDRHNRLSSYSKQYSGQNAYKHQLRLEAEARCPQKTHKLMAEIKGACDARMKHCKVYVDAQRTPMKAENQPWKLNAKIQTVAPEIIREEEDPSQKQSRMLVKLDSQWGSEQNNQLNLRLQAEPTKKTMWRSQSSDKWSRFLNKIDMVAEYQVHPETKHILQRAYEMVKAKLFWQLSTEQRRGEEGLVRATVVIDPISRRYTNITVQTPHERLRAESVELPTQVMTTVYYPLERRPANLRSIGGLMQSFGGSSNAQCRADDRRVRTFDGVSYKAPLSSCWTVLAKDCSNRDEPRFVVLMKKDGQEKKVKIITPESTIELSGSEDQKMKVKINGQHIQDEDRLSEEGVELNFDKAYVQKRGVSVEFDGDEAKVKVSSQYKNVQCGLCGHYNDEEEDVFRMSNNKRSNNLKEFHRSYALKNEECDEKQLDKFYQDSDEFSMRPNRRHQRYAGRQQRNNQWFEDSDEDSTERRDNDEWDRSEGRNDDRSQSKNNKPVDRTEVIEYNHKVCFSTEPVKRCPRGTTSDMEAQTKPVKAQFFCVDRTSVEGRQLQRQVRRGQTVESQGRSPSFVETVEQPTKCLAY